MLYQMPVRKAMRIAAQQLQENRKASIALNSTRAQLSSLFRTINSHGNAATTAMGLYRFVHFPCNAVTVGEEKVLQEQCLQDFASQKIDFDRKNSPNKTQKFKLNHELNFLGSRFFSEEGRRKIRSPYFSFSISNLLWLDTNPPSGKPMINI